MTTPFQHATTTALLLTLDAVPVRRLVLGAVVAVWPLHDIAITNIV